MPARGRAAQPSEKLFDDLTLELEPNCEAEQSPIPPISPPPGPIGTYLSIGTSRPHSSLLAAGRRRWSWSHAYNISKYKSALVVAHPGNVVLPLLDPEDHTITVSSSLNFYISKILAALRNSAIDCCG
jgi:hypothetical protein